MPIIKSSYKVPLFYYNRHVQTILPSLFRKTETRMFSRTRIKTSDNDFLDLDLIPNGYKRCVVISHGLEGNSHRSYVTNLAYQLMTSGYDICAWNFRGCSGEINKQARMYHSGSTEDLETVIEYLKPKYDEIYMVGFSMGGNLTLKYLGERRDQLNSKIKGAVTFSVPTDLSASVDKLGKWYNRIYMKRFLNTLKSKLVVKEAIFPNLISVDNYDSIKNFREFDDRYTAPMHGFESANDYYEKCSSKQFIQSISIPTLIVNAKDDPFLTESCFPITECKNSEHVYLEMPKGGGHVGFMIAGGVYWSEKRTLEFLRSINS